MEELVAQQKEWQELRKKEEAWNETKQHQTSLLKFKHKKEALEREKELWLQEQEIETNAIDKMFVKIIHMKSMFVAKEFHRQRVEEENKHVVLDILTIQKEMLI